MAIRRYLSALLVTFIIAAPAFAQQGSADRMDRRLEVLDEKLDLTDDQASQIRQIWEAHRDEMRAWLSENEEATREERREHFRGRADEVQASVRAVLTSDQAAQYAEFRQERRDGLRNRAERPRSRMGVRGARDGDRPGRGMRGMRDGRRGDGDVRGTGPGADMFMGRFAEELELTDAQRDELREIVESHRAEGSAWREANPDATREQRQAYHDGHFAHLKTKLGEVLTPEQLQKFEELHETRRERMQKRNVRN